MMYVDETGKVHYISAHEKKQQFTDSQWACLCKLYNKK